MTFNLPARPYVKSMYTYKLHIRRTASRSRQQGHLRRTPAIARQSQRIVGRTPAQYPMGLPLLPPIHHGKDPLSAHIRD
ncbi:hypothetical protein CR513_22204, partial [Mucuna pruriens]